MKDSSNFFRLSIRPWGLLTAAGAIGCLVTVLGFLGRFSWFLDLFSHFRVQYLVGLSILSGIMLVARRRKAAGIFLGFACLNLVSILPLYFGGPRDSVNDRVVLRAILLNVNTRLGNPDRVKQAILNANPDILVLEEISSQWIADLSWLEKSYPHRVAQPREDNFGISLFSKLPLVDSQIVYVGRAEVPTILTTVETGETNLRVIATHPLPPIGRENSSLRNEQLAKLSEYVAPALPVILLGDLNTTPWNYHFRRLLKRSGLKDSTKGYGVQPTWPNNIPLIRIPIDHCLHSSTISIVDRRIGQDVSSDHHPLIVDFSIVDKSDQMPP